MTNERECLEVVRRRGERMLPRSCPLCGLGPCRRGFPAYKQPEEESMSDYYNGFDANARAEKNKPGVERALLILGERAGRYRDQTLPVPEGLTEAIEILQRERTRINYLIAELGDA